VVVGDRHLRPIFHCHAEDVRIPSATGAEDGHRSRHHPEIPLDENSAKYIRSGAMDVGGESQTR